MAKLGEASIMADSGVDDILIVYPLIGNNKLDRLMRLGERVKCAVAVDSLAVAQGISRSCFECWNYCRSEGRVDSDLAAAACPSHSA